MPNLSSLVIAIQELLQDSAYTDEIVIDRINEAVLNIAAGIRMPNGQISPPLPDLYKYDTVNTSISLPYVSLPSDYQRKVFNVIDDTHYQILSPRGGDYYAFNRFLKQINDMSLAESGSIYRVCVKGTKLYYQGIPATSTVLGVHYYRKPDTLVLDGDIPEGIPDHLQSDIIKHYVCKSIFGERIEDGQDNTGVGAKYHTGQFFEDMQNLIDFIGIDAEPEYYGTGGFEDRGVVDG